MSDLEYSLYCHMHSFCLEQCPGACPDAILYLKTSPEICLERLQQRGRRLVLLEFGKRVCFSQLTVGVSNILNDDNLRSVHLADSYL